MRKFLFLQTKSLRNINTNKILRVTFKFYSMSVKIQCPACLEKYVAGEEYIGQRFRCRCDAVVEVPKLSVFAKRSRVQANPPRTSPEISAQKPTRKSSTSRPTPPSSGKTSANRDSDHDKTPSEKRSLTVYGLLAIFFGTSGILAALACFAFLGSMFFSPILKTRQNDLEALGIAACVFIVAFTLAAFFRLADLALRRSNTRLFF